MEPEEQEEQEELEEPEADEPQTRKELYAYYSGKGPAAMVYDFMSDKILQGQCIILYTVAGPLEKLYQNSLKLVGSGVDGRMRFHAQRAFSNHLSVALECATMYSNDELMHRLGFPGSLTQDMPHPELDPRRRNSPEHILHKLIFDFGWTLASEIVWTHLHFSWCFPHCLAVSLLPNPEQRAKGLADVLELARAVEAAEKVEGPKAELKQCLEHLSFNVEYLPRLLMQKGLRDGFDTDEMRRWAAANWSSTSSTKELLESAFNNCNRQISFMSTSKVASHFMKWIVTTLNPFVQKAGIDQILPSETDWWQTLNSPKGQQAVRAWSDRWFDINSFPLPTLPEAESTEGEKGPAAPFTGQAILSKMNFKAAGADAMRRSTAAAAYLVSDYKTGFRHCGSCWTGGLGRTKKLS